MVDPYLNHRNAQQSFGAVEHEARQCGIDCRRVYAPDNLETDAITELWQALQPRDIVLPRTDEHLLSGIPSGKLERSADSQEALAEYRTQP